MLRPFVKKDVRKVNLAELPAPIKKIAQETDLLEEKCETVHSHYGDQPSHDHWNDSAPIEH